MDYETRMEDLGYATLESWKMLRDELDNRIKESIKRMIGGKQMKRDWKLAETILKEIIDKEPNLHLGGSFPKDLVERLKEDGYLPVALHNRYAPIPFVLQYKDLIQMHFLHHSLIIDPTPENTVKLEGIVS